MPEGVIFHLTARRAVKKYVANTEEGELLKSEQMRRIIKVYTFLW